MRVFFLLFFSVFVLHAQTIELEEIVQKLRSEHPMAKAIQALEHAHHWQNRAVASGEPLALVAEGSYAKPDMQKSAYEYGVGIEKNIMHPDVKKQTLLSTKYENEADILQRKHTFALLENDVRSLYHESCLQMQSKEDYFAALRSYEILYSKKAKAYEYKEISKKELLMLQIELDRLRGEYKLHEHELQTAHDALNAKILLPSLQNRELSCRDMLPLVKEVTFDVQNTTLKEESFEKKILMQQSDFAKHDVLFDSFTLGAFYAQEMDREKFTLSLSLPLNFTSSYSEEKRTEALHKKSTLLHEKEEAILQKASDKVLFTRELQQNLQSIETHKAILQKYENELMPLLKSAYELGEDSVSEYILGQREFLRLKGEFADSLKKYYKTLFQLYGVLQTKDEL